MKFIKVTLDAMISSKFIKSLSLPEKTTKLRSYSMMH